MFSVNQLLVYRTMHSNTDTIYTHAGNADSQYLAQADGDRAKRAAIGVYEQSGLSGYTVPKGINPVNQTVVFGAQGPNFPVTWYFELVCFGNIRTLLTTYDT